MNGSADTHFVHVLEGTWSRRARPGAFFIVVPSGGLVGDALLRLLAELKVWREVQLAALGDE